MVEDMNVKKQLVYTWQGRESFLPSCKLSYQMKHIEWPHFHAVKKVGHFLDMAGCFDINISVNGPLSP